MPGGPPGALKHLASTDADREPGAASRPCVDADAPAQLPDPVADAGQARDTNTAEPVLMQPLVAGAHADAIVRDDEGQSPPAVDNASADAGGLGM